MLEDTVEVNGLLLCPCHLGHLYFMIILRLLSITFFLFAAELEPLDILICSYFSLISLDLRS